MKGGIYSDERCPVCGGPYRDNGRDGLVCPRHPEQRARTFKVKFGRKMCRRFVDDYGVAFRFLTGLRYKTDEGTFDLRDYREDRPLGFRSLAESWLVLKEKEVRKGTYKNLANYMRRAADRWGDRNVKEITYGDVEDFLAEQTLEGSDQPLSGKTKSNIRSALHDFWVWLRKRRVIRTHEMPEFPHVKYELGLRDTIDKPTQESILDEIHKISCHINPKVYLGIKWLCTYVSIRPGELAGIREKNLDPENGYIIIPHPKEKKPKMVPLLEEDVEMIRTLPRGMPELPFFRHAKGIKGCKPGSPFGEKYFYKWWKRACENLGIRGVDLYGGTRHSSVRALRQYRTPEEIKQATMHSTNRAFERYFRIESSDLRNIYQDAVVRRRMREKGKGKVLIFPNRGKKLTHQ